MVIDDTCASRRVCGEARDSYIGICIGWMNASSTRGGSSARHGRFDIGGVGSKTATVLAKPTNIVDRRFLWTDVWYLRQRSLRPVAIALLTDPVVRFDDRHSINE